MKIETKNQVETNQPLPDVRVIWGRTLLAIKQAGKIMLHTVCVNLGKVALRDGTLLICVPSKLDYEILKKSQNCGDLVETLHKLGYNLNIEFLLDEASNDNLDRVSRLKNLLGADIKVI